MDKIEKIRQEIERQISAHDSVDHLEAFEVGKAWNRGHRKALDSLLSFIDTLSEEPDKSLEEAAEKRYPSEKLKFDSAFGVFEFDKHKPERDAFIAGAEWMVDYFEKERLKDCDKLTPEDAQLEDDFVESHFKKNQRTPTFIDAIKYGAELQKKRFEAEYELDWITDLKKDLYELGRKDEREQIMKEAVEGMIIDSGFDDGTAFVMMNIPDRRYNQGDKVRIIIVKEE